MRPVGEERGGGSRPLLSLLPWIFFFSDFILKVYKEVEFLNFQLKISDGLNENLSSISICSSSRCPSDWDVFFGQVPRFGAIYSLRRPKKKVNLELDVTYYMSRFIVLGYVTSSTRLVFYGMKDAAICTRYFFPTPSSCQLPLHPTCQLLPSSKSLNPKVLSIFHFFPKNIIIFVVPMC
jgi:hypothetical protein